MLYLITDRTLFDTDEAMFKCIESALDAGIRMLQLREKTMPERHLLSMAHRLRVLAQKYSAKLFINDRLDIALCIDAEGVHLGQSSMPADTVRSVLNQHMLMGVSTHNIQEALEAQGQGADFITFGPVFETPSKKRYGPPVGLDRLTEAAEALSIPVYAIGGIKLRNVDAVMERGARGIALISGILASEDAYKTTKQYLSLLGETR